MMDRADTVHENFLRRIAEGDWPHRRSAISLDDAGLAPEHLVELFHTQVLSRQLDRVSRKLQARGEGYYTIGSSGHEGNAAIAAALRPTDMAFLHYRDAAFQIQRARQVPGRTPLWDMLLSFVTSSEDPISGGRHKVLGSKALNIPPQTSTIASHLPKAVGAAYSIGVAHRLGPKHKVMPDDAIVHCSFGDASINHASAQAAFNTASWTAFQGIPMPLLFVCEDNGIGISIKTPSGWIEAAMKSRPGLRYFKCNGLDAAETYTAACEAAKWVRQRHKPAFLHMTCVRLYGHAGADAQTVYLTKSEIEADEANDPLLYTAGLLVREGILTPQQVGEIYLAVEQRAERVATHVVQRPKLEAASDVMASLVPNHRANSPTKGPTGEWRAVAFGDTEMRALKQPQHMAKLINLTLTDLMLEHHEIVLAGQDIGQKGGVYGVTQRLLDRFGAARVIDTLLDEQSILGLAIGLAHNGILPIPEIQFLAYLHNAEDQLRGEAATLSFFSNRQYTNPMVIRIAGLGCQRGFGGHFHNDNSLAVLRDIPSIVVACPSNGLDAVLMLRECVRLSREEQRVVVIVGPIALYMTRDLHDPKDGEWYHRYPQPDDGAHIALDQIGQYGTGIDLAIVSYGNGYYLSRQAEKILREKHGIDLRVIDLRWLAPLAEEALLDATEPCRHVLIVDECRITGSQSEALLALFAERGVSGVPVRRIAAADSFIATGSAFGATLPNRDGIVEAALELTRSDVSGRAAE